MTWSLFDQEVLSDRVSGTHGDCFRACVNSLVGRDLKLPHPINAAGDDWSDSFWDALEGEGLVARMVVFHEARNLDHLPRVVIASGPSVRTEENGCSHAVIWDRITGRCLHDPHPSRAGIERVNFMHWIERIAA